MSQLSVDASELKAAVKEAIVETLRDEKDLVHRIVADAIEEIGLSEAIRRGRKSGVVERESVVKALRSKS